MAYFVAQRLSILDSVQSTATHFVLKPYKLEGVILEDDDEDNREVISL